MTDKLNSLNNPGYIYNNKLINLFFRIFLSLFRSKKRGKFVPEKTNFVIFKVGALGDYVLCLDFIILISKAFPESKIIVLGAPQAKVISALFSKVDKIVTSNIIGTKSFPNILSKNFYKELLRIRKATEEKGYENFFICLNRLETYLGILKCVFFKIIINSRFALGYDTVGRGVFFNIKVKDFGYLIKHEYEYQKEIALQLFNIFHKDTLFYQTLINVRDPQTIWENNFNNSRSIKIIIHPGGGSNPKAEKWLHKRWDVKNYIELIRKLNEKNAVEIFLTGIDSEINLAEVIVNSLGENIKITNLVGKSSLNNLISILQSSDLYIGTDSGVAHLASYINMPTIVMFFYSDFIGFSPVGDNTLILTPKIKCSPCLYWYNSRPCKGSYWAFKCREEITTQDVYEGVEKLLHKLLIN